MKNLFTQRLRSLCLPALLWLAASFSVHAQSWQWATSPSAGYGAGSVVDSAGNVYVTGRFSGTATFGATTLTSLGFTDVYVAKLTSTGTYEWAVRAGGSNADDGVGVAVGDSGNVYVTGGFSSGTATFGATTLTLLGSYDVFVAKLTPAGAWQWAVSAGGTNADFSSAVAVDSSGTVCITGGFTSLTANFGATTLTNGGDYDMFVAKLTTGGSWQSATRAGGTGFDYGSGVAVDGSGNTVVAGYFSGATATFGATTLTNAGTIAGSYDVFVAKLTAAGTWQWAVRAGGTDYDYPQRMAVDATGNVYITGGFASSTVTLGPSTLTNANPGSADVFVAKLNSSGTFQWATRAGGNAADDGIGVAVDSSGSVYVTGGFNSDSISFGATTLANANADSADVFVARLTPAGAWQWAVRAGGLGVDYGVGIVVDRSGNAYVSGYFASRTATFGPTTITNSARAGNYAIFISRVSPLPLAVADEAATPAFTLAPNPAHTAATLTGAPGSTAILLDGLGRVVRTVPLTNGAATLDMRGLVAGLYVVRCGGAARRLVVE